MKNKVVRIVIKTLIVFVLAIIAIIGILGGAVRPILYNEFYDIREDVCKNPGLNDGFVPQGIAVDKYNNDEVIITCGYMTDDSPSRIYITNKDNESRYVELYMTNEEKYVTNHSGGIAISNGIVYLCRNKNITMIPLKTLIEADGKVEFDSTKDFKVGHVASFAYADDNYLYVGEFASSGDYEKSNYVETNDGTYFAICSVFSLDDMSLVKVYSIRNKVQGFCVTENGTIVLSTSQSFYSSEYYIYNQSDIRKAENNIVKGEEIDVPLYILDTPSKIIKGTCMSEDLSYYNGKVYTLTESACNKYILGKFFFAYDIFSLDIE